MDKKEVKYSPISCTFYDLLEEASTLQKSVEIVYKVRNAKKTIHSRIYDLYLRNKAEYMLVEGGLEIQLDQLIAIDGNEITGFC